MAAKKRSTAKLVEVMVQLHPDFCEKIKEVSALLEQEGLAISDTFEHTGTLVGTVSPAAKERLTAVEGVAAVEVTKNDYETY